MILNQPVKLMQIICIRNQDLYNNKILYIYQSLILLNIQSMNYNLKIANINFNIVRNLLLSKNLQKVNFFLRIVKKNNSTQQTMYYFSNNYFRVDFRWNAIPHHQNLQFPGINQQIILTILFLHKLYKSFKISELIHIKLSSTKTLNQCT